MQPRAILVVVLAGLTLSACGDGKPREDKSLPLPEQARRLESALTSGVHYDDLRKRFKPDRYWLVIDDPERPGHTVGLGKIPYRESSFGEAMRDQPGIQAYGLQYEFGDILRDEWAYTYEVDFDKDGKYTKFNRFGRGDEEAAQ